MISQGNDCDKIRSGSQSRHLARASSNPDEKEASTSSLLMNNVASMTSTSDETVNVQKPIRPLTAYHLFFQLEREYIIQTSRHDDDDGSRSDGEKKNDDRPLGREINDEMPFRYRYIHLSPHWYASGSGKRLKGSSRQAQKKRKHRKTHGIGFLELSRMISSKWSQLEYDDMETKNYVNKIAARELAVYKRDMEWYKSNVVRHKKDSSASIDSRESFNSQGSSPKPPVPLDLIASSPKKVGAKQVAQPMARDQSDRTNEPYNERKHADNKSSTEEFTFHPVPSSQMPESYKRLTQHNASAPAFRHRFIGSYGHNKSDTSSGSLSPIPLSDHINPPAPICGNEQYRGTMRNEWSNPFLNHGRTDGSFGDVLPSGKGRFKRRSSSSPYQRRDVMRTISDYGGGSTRVVRSQPFEEDSANETAFTLDDAIDLMKALAD